MFRAKPAYKKSSAVRSRIEVLEEEICYLKELQKELEAKGSDEEIRLRILRNQRNRKLIVIDGVEYPSLNEASRKTGFAITKIRKIQQSQQRT